MDPPVLSHTDPETPSARDVPGSSELVLLVPFESEDLDQWDSEEPEEEEPSADN